MRHLSIQGKLLTASAIWSFISLLILPAMLLSCTEYINISGKVTDLVSGETVAGVNIYFEHDDNIPVTISELDGRFSVSIKNHGKNNTRASLVLTKEGYMDKTIGITEEVADLGEIALKPEDQVWKTGKVFRWGAYDGDPELLVRAATDAGLNMISVMDRYFTRGDSINYGLIELAEAAEIKVFVIFQTFYNDDATIDESNSARDLRGDMVRDSWLSFICPNDEVYKSNRLGEIENVVRTVRPHGISMDFFRYFVYWEAGRDGNRAQTCFCNRCLDKFESVYGVSGDPDQILSGYPDEWTDFKCGTINEYAALIHDRVKKIDPGILLNLHMVPWKQDDYDGAIRKIAAQDILILSRYFDFIQPMTYSTMLDESIEWILDMGADAGKHVSDTYVIPCIQAADATPENLNIIARSPLHGYSIWPFERY